MGIGQKYLVFLWKPVRGMDAYTVTRAYLLKDDGVSYSIDDADTVTGLQTAAFEAAVNSAIRRMLTASQPVPEVISCDTVTASARPVVRPQRDGYTVAP